MGKKRKKEAESKKDEEKNRTKPRLYHKTRSKPSKKDDRDRKKEN